MQWGWWWLLAVVVGLLGTTIFFAIQLNQRSDWNQYHVASTDEKLWSECGCNQPFQADMVHGTLPEKRIALQTLWQREMSGQTSTSICYKLLGR
jgi:hypothetical protein